MEGVRVGRFRGGDGAELGYRAIGAGRTAVLLHGFFSDAVAHWIEPGHAARLVAAGHEVVMPDLRGHGLSAGPSGAARYPGDVLVDDGLALIDHLGIRDYDLVGYSLGGRTALRMMVRGARPRRAVIAGMGLDAIVEPGGKGTWYRDVLENLGSFEEETPEWRAERHLATLRADPEALLHVLDCSLPTDPTRISAVSTPTLVLLGTEDRRHRSAAELATLLPAGTFGQIPGSHTRAIRRPELGAAIADHLGAVSRRS